MNNKISSVVVLVTAVTLSVFINSFIAAPKKANAERFRISPGNCDSGATTPVDGDAYDDSKTSYGTKFSQVYTQTLSYFAFFNVNDDPFGNKPSDFHTLNCGPKQAMTAVKLKTYKYGGSSPEPDGVSYNIKCCDLVGS